MKQVVVMSGKGGSGKTFVSSSLAAVAAAGPDATVLADCDVDAANLHLMLAPRDTACESFASGRLAKVDPTRCTACGRCVAACRFDAIHLERRSGPARTGEQTPRTVRLPAVVDAIACEGCGVCALVCPEGAISLAEQHRGTWCISRTPYGPLVHARLEPGEENSGKLVARIRQAATQRATAEASPWILIDGPPGIGCAAKSAMTGTDYVLIVAEPTASGVHDMLRVVELARHFRIPIGLLVNKADLSTRQTNELRRIAACGSIALLGEIPFSRAVPEALTRLVPYPTVHDDRITETLRAAWSRMRGELAARS